MALVAGFQRDPNGNLTTVATASGVSASQATTNVTIPAGTTAQVISAVPGRLYYILATAAGTNLTAGTLSDGSTVIAVILPSIALGSLIQCSIPFSSNLTYSCPTGGPALTIGVS